jgi:large subunit ribosomal protein L23
MDRLHTVIRRPLTTEKSGRQQGASNQYSFEVSATATKPEIAAAVQKIFGVTVLRVRTMNSMGKVKRMGRFSGRRPDAKKAVVTLKPGDEIQIYENV